MTEWLNWCRLCGRKNMSNSYDLYATFEPQVGQEIDFEITLAAVVQQFFKIEISTDDGMPERICTVCYDMTYSHASLLIYIKHVERMYRNLASQQKNCYNYMSIRAKYGVYDDLYIQGNGSFFPELQTDVKGDYKVEESVYAEDEEALFGELKYDIKATCYACQGSGGLQLKDFSTQDVPTKVERTEIELENHADDSPLYEETPELKELLSQLTCQHCSLVLQSQLALLLHEKNVHGLHKRFICSVCERHFSSDASLKTHEMKHARMEMRKKIPCELCDQLFCTKSSLLGHVRRVHNNERPYICEICGAARSSTNLLEKHMLTHTNERPYPCDICNRSYKSTVHLRKHKLIHEPNKHICSQCGLKLNSIFTLKKHLKLVHSNVRRHACTVCPATFKESFNLKIHLLGHTHLRPFSCRYCSFTFNHALMARKHVQRHHGEEMKEPGDTLGYTASMPPLSELKLLLENPANIRTRSGRGRRRKEPKSEEKVIILDDQFLALME